MTTNKNHDNEKNIKTFFLELKKLKINRKTSEKEWIYSISQTNKFSQNELMEIEEETNKEFNNEMKKIQRNIKKIQSKVEEFKHELSKDRSTRNVSKIKSLMESTEAFMTDFKETQQEVFRDLIKSEKLCENEIEFINSRIEGLSKPRSERTTKTHTTSTTSLQHGTNLPTAVIKFQKYSEASGLTGGWDEQDHSTYVKLRKKYKGSSKEFAAFVQSYMPFRRRDDISKHDAWFKKFIDLKRDKNLAIENWRVEKESLSKQNGVEDNIEPVKTGLSEAELFQQERKKQMVADWKKAKMLEKEEKQRQEIERENLKKRTEFLNREEQRKAHEVVLKQLQEKREQEQRCQWTKEMEYQEDLAERQKHALTNMKKFQERDQSIITHKLHVRRLKEKEAEIAKIKLEKTKEKVSVPRDSRRLYELTEAWVQRRNAEPEEVSVATTAYKMPHRAVPGWRQTS